MSQSTYARERLFALEPNGISSNMPSMTHAVVKLIQRALMPF
jgi:hypothetical protein